MEKRPTEIKDFKRMPYLPRLGKIRLGVKAKSAKSGKEYPKEVDYFVCPPEVQKVYGEKPTLIDVMFPSEQQADCIPYCYKSYSSTQRLKCKGNGETATFFNQETKEMEERTCPCEALDNGNCSKRGHLMIILPKVSLGGVYQVDTGSGVNINRVLDAMDYWKGMVGRCKCIPLTLERVKEKMQGPDGKMQPHYLFRFSTKLNIDSLNQAIENNRKILAVEYKIERPVEEGKLDDTPVEIIENGEVDDKPVFINEYQADELNKTVQWNRDKTGLTGKDFLAFLGKYYGATKMSEIKNEDYLEILEGVKSAETLDLLCRAKEEEMEKLS